jgi:hypothetical protein
MGKRYSEEKLRKLEEVVQSEEEKVFLREADDPVLWAENHFFDPDEGETPFKAKKMFCNLLRDDRKDRAGRVGRQCLAEGTVIHTRDGGLVPIEDHPDSWLTGERDIFEIRAEGGYIVRATDNHPIFTNRGWKTVRELVSGDEIAVLTSWNKWGDDIVPYSYSFRRGKTQRILEEGTITVNKEVAELLGWLTGDGTCMRGGKQRKQSIKLTNVTTEYIERVEELVAAHFPDVTPKKYPKGKGYDVLLTGDSHAYGHNSLKHFMRCMQFVNGFPTAVANYFSRENVCAFFKGMYPTDGYVYYRKKSQKYECGLSGGNNWIYAQYNRELLNKLGVRSQVKQERIKKNKDGSKFCRIVFSGSDNAETFNSIINIQGKKSPRVSTWGRKPRYKLENGFVGEDGESLHYTMLLRIIRIGKGRVWDIEYPNKGWFLAGGVKVHNSGKSCHLTVDLMHTASWNSRAVILVFLPEKKNMNRLLEIMNNYLRRSDIRGSFSMGGKKEGKKGEIRPDYDYEISVSSGSVIRFFFMSHNPDKARGQRGTHIYIDEVDYLPEKAFPVILGVLKSCPTIKILATSTPCGLENTWFREFCDKCADPKNRNGVEYHMPTTMEENWPEIEERLRDVIFDEVTWKLEVMAEWAEAKGAVYKKELIDEAIERSKIAGMYIKSEDITMTVEYETSVKCIGVDWNNPQNGVRIVELAEMYGKPWVVRNEKIAYEKYTQLAAVERILELHAKCKYLKIAVDSGYGAAQIELMHKKLVEMGEDPASLLMVVDSGRKEEVVIEYKSPSTGARRKETISTRIKNRLVGLLSKYIEESLVFMEEEDVDRDGLVKETRNFRRKSSIREGGFIYSETTHSLAALQLCVYGYNSYLIDGVRRHCSAPDAMECGPLDDIIKERMGRMKTTSIVSQGFATGSLPDRALGTRTFGLTDHSGRRGL